MVQHDWGVTPAVLLCSAASAASAAAASSWDCPRWTCASVYDAASVFVVCPADYVFVVFAVLLAPCASAWSAALVSGVISMSFHPPRPPHAAAAAVVSFV